MKNACQLMLIALSLCVTTFSSCQEKEKFPSVNQYPSGYPDKEITAINQLRHYPLPRYLPGNHLMRLFDWMDPQYMGGRGQKEKINYVQNSVSLVDELAHNWNYGIVSSIVNGTVDGNYMKTDTSCPEMVRLANNNPQIPFDVITYWLSSKPFDMGFKDRKAEVMKKNLDSNLYVSFDFYGKTAKEIDFNFHDSLIKIDGETKAYTFRKMEKFLTRPINRINENGEEPPGAYRIRSIANDPAMVKMKDSMKIDSWQDFISIRKLEMRNTYSSAFLKGIPELNNTFFSFYTIEGGPIDRFKWSIMKKAMTPLNGNYYSTPDFYPRWPKNWKDWTGAWHGWHWIEIGRKVEVKDGDNLFSPFVAAGWSNKYEENITPGQWLGLLKCLSVVGAEFYYVGYFNLNAPFTNPSDYTWQAAMPAYAQAITSRYEDILKNGNVLFDENKEPIINYPNDDRHVLIVARKLNNAEKYVIAGTYQPFSNDSTEIPESTNVTTTINGHTLSFEVRRQGSVYIYEKTPDNRTIFYQLDRWHENKHPERWSKDYYFESEVADSGVTSGDIYTTTDGAEGDYTKFTSYVHIEKKQQLIYHFSSRDSVNEDRFLFIRCKGKGILSIGLKNEKGQLANMHNTLPNSNSFQWIKIVIPAVYQYFGNNTLKITTSNSEIDLDKFVITTNGKFALTD